MLILNNWALMFIKFKSGHKFARKIIKEQTVCDRQFEMGRCTGKTMSPKETGETNILMKKETFDYQVIGLPLFLCLISYHSQADR